MSAARARRAPLALAAALVLAGGISLVAQWQWRREPPPDASWQAAAAVLQDEWHAGDALYVWPVWAAVDGSTLRRFFDAAGAVDDAVWLHADPLERTDLLRHPHLWVLAAWDEPLPDTLRGAETIGAWAGLRLWRYTRPGPAPLYDFVANLRDARVSRTAPRSRHTACRWRRDRFVCDRRWWTQVRARVVEVGHTRRYVVWAHAWPDRATLHIAFPHVPVRQRLEGGVSLTLEAVRKRAGGPTTFRVLVAGAVQWEVTMDPRDFEWHRFSIDTSQWAGQQVEVSFELTAPHADRRRVGFDALSL